MRVYEAKLVYEATLFEVGATALNSAELVYEYMKDTLEVYPTQEVFHVILLNRKNRPLGRNLATIGTAGSTSVHPREVYRPAIIGGASAIICVHNLCDASHRLCYVASRAMWSDGLFFGGASLCAAA